MTTKIITKLDKMDRSQLRKFITNHIEAMKEDQEYDLWDCETLEAAFEGNYNDVAGLLDLAYDLVNVFPITT